MTSEPGLIDLHCHSTASDGSLTPSELVRKAIDAGLRAVAITDHDTVEGVPEALAEGKRTGFELVPGIEISAEMSSGTMHILGYYIEHLSDSLLNTLKKLQDAREERNRQIIQRLRALHLAVTYEELLDVAENGQIGRPHLARLLVRKGFVSDTQAAFDRYLKKGRPAYVDKFRFSPQEAVQLIVKANGMPVLAHPGSLRQSPENLEKIALKLQDAGLQGMEVYYSEHTPEQTACYLRLCRKLNLLPTGGTDYHGSYKPYIALGSGHGNMRIPYELLSTIKRQRRE